MSNPLAVSLPAGTAGLVLVNYPNGDGVSLCYRSAEGVLQLPPIMEFQDYGQGIFGTRTAPGTSPHFRMDPATGRLFLNE